MQPRACFACVCWSATHRAGHVHGIPYSPPGSPGPGGSQPSASRAQKAREDRLRVHPPQYHKGQDMHGAHTLHSVSCPAFPPNALWPSLPVTGSPLESMKSPTGKSRRKNMLLLSEDHHRHLKGGEASSGPLNSQGGHTDIVCVFYRGKNHWVPFPYQGFGIYMQNPLKPPTLAS